MKSPPPDCLFPFGGAWLIIIPMDSGFYHHRGRRSVSTDGSPARSVSDLGRQLKELKEKYLKLNAEVLAFDSAPERRRESGAND
jgi:hypothetical protein